MQNCKELRIMKSLRQNTNPGSQGKEVLWKKKEVGFQIECKIPMFGVNFGSHPFEHLLIRDYTKNSCILFSWAEKSLKFRILHIFSGVFCQRYQMGGMGRHPESLTLEGFEFLASLAPSI